MPKISQGPWDIPLGLFPETASGVPADPEGVVTELIKTFNEALHDKDPQRLVGVFLENCYWRDHLCLSWDLHTLKGREQIAQFLHHDIRITSIAVDRSTPFRAPHVGPIDAFGDVVGIELFIQVTTEVGPGQGVMRLAEAEGRWKVFTLFTSLRELKGFEERVYHRRPRGVEHGGLPGRRNWLDKRTAEIDFKETEPAVLIVGIGKPAPC